MAKPLSSEQRSWLKELGTIVGQASTADVVEEAPASGSTKSIGGGADKALFGIPFIPEVPLVTTRITIKNKANVALRVVSGSAKLENLQAFVPQAASGRYRRAVGGRLQRHQRVEDPAGAPGWRHRRRDSLRHRRRREEGAAVHEVGAWRHRSFAPADPDDHAR